MVRLPSVLFLACFVFLAANSSAFAVILSVVESNLGADAPAIIVNGGFTEDVLALADRDHQHNGPRFTDAFGAGSLVLTPTPSGTTVLNVPLPAYMVGGDYVRFANNARDNVGYSAVVTAAGPKDWYLLIDNRWDGPNGVNDGTFFNDPVLGGNLQWVIDDGWQRVNTGLSPVSILGAVGDYTALDEFQNSDPNTLGVGPGVLVDNFFAIYTRKNLSSVTLGSLAMSGATMYGLVAIPEPASLMLLVCGALGLATTRRLRR